MLQEGEGFASARAHLAVLYAHHDRGWLAGWLARGLARGLAMACDGHRLIGRLEAPSPLTSFAASSSKPISQRPRPSSTQVSAPVSPRSHVCRRCGYPSKTGLIFNMSGGKLKSAAAVQYVPVRSILQIPGCLAGLLCACHVEVRLLLLDLFRNRRRRVTPRECVKRSCRCPFYNDSSPEQPEERKITVITSTDSAALEYSSSTAGPPFQYDRIPSRTSLSTWKPLGIFFYRNSRTSSSVQARGGIASVGAEV